METDNIVISDEIKRYIEEIIIENGLKPTSGIKYGPGSETGDGFSSKTFTVYVCDEEKKLNLFCKVPVAYSWQKNLLMKKVTANEILFYDTIYPAYQSFLREYGTEDSFRHVPKCYGIRNELIALENLKSRGFSLFNNKRLMNDDHIVLTFKTFAKFHAISYAIKDQKKELYNTFIKSRYNCFSDIISAGFDNIMSSAIQQFLKSLDPTQDKRLLDGSGNLAENLVDIVLNVDNICNEYSIITQGDSWCNNVMYLYDEKSQESPIDVMLVDWQLLRFGSPVVSLSYFFYPISSEATIHKIQYYLKIYHEELSRIIRHLGSDPDVLYPYSVLKEEWKKFAKFGFGMCFLIVKALLMDKIEIPNLEDMEKLLSKIKNEDKYFTRMKVILKHFIENDLL